VAFRAGAGVQQVIPADGLGIRVRQDGKGVSRLLTQVGGLLGRIDADRDGADTGLGELIQAFFDAS
jgi:hypothetical protein